MTLESTFTCRDRAIFLSDIEALVLADVHLGRDWAGACQLPIESSLDFPGRLRSLCDRFEPAHVVIAGDVLDCFRQQPPGVHDRLAAIIDVIHASDANPVLITGNHDLQLERLSTITPRSEWVIDDTVICHGHRVPSTAGRRYIIGHQHPAIRIEGIKRPCVLAGAEAFQDADLLVLPAFSPLTRGTVMNHRGAADCDSPVLQDASVRALQPVVRDEAGDTTIWFPSLEELAPYL